MKQKYQVFSINMREIFIRNKVQDAFILFSCLNYLSSLGFSQFFDAKNIPCWYISCARRKKHETHAQCVKLTVFDEMSNIKLSYLNYYL